MSAKRSGPYNVWISTPIGSSEEYKKRYAAMLFSAVQSAENQLLSNDDHCTTLYNHELRVSWWSKDKKYSGSHIQESDLVVFLPDFDNPKFMMPIGCKREYLVANNFGKLIKLGRADIKIFYDVNVSGDNMCAKDPIPIPVFFNNVFPLRRIPYQSILCPQQAESENQADSEPKEYQFPDRRMLLLV